MPLTIGSWLSPVFLAVCAWMAIQNRLHEKRLADVTPAPGDSFPPLAVVVPALNEGAGIREALESLAAQDYPDLLVIPINDRSTDRTGEIMDEVASVHPRIHPIHVRDLPPGWVGKNHANWVGANEARRRGAEWILFTDGDIQFAPDTLRKAWAYIEQNSLDHLAVMPEMLFRGFAQTVFTSTFMVWFSLRFQPWKVNDPQSRQFIGVGAFNLVRATAYEAIGGHRPLALTVADDLALGKLVKRGGFRQGFLQGKGEVMLPLPPTLTELVRGLYKNSFASFNFNPLFSLVAAYFIFKLNVYSFVRRWLAPDSARISSGIALGCLLLSYFQASRFLGRPVRGSMGIALMAWTGGFLFVWTLLASTLLTLRQGGVVWRGTLYPTRLLKEHQVKV